MGYTATLKKPDVKSGLDQAEEIAKWVFNWINQSNFQDGVHHFSSRWYSAFLVLALWFISIGYYRRTWYLRFLAIFSVSQKTWQNQTPVFGIRALSLDNLLLFLLATPVQVTQLSHLFIHYFVIVRWWSLLLRSILFCTQAQDGKHGCTHCTSHKYRLHLQVLFCGVQFNVVTLMAYGSIPTCL